MKQVTPTHLDELIGLILEDDELRRCRIVGELGRTFWWDGEVFPNPRLNKFVGFMEGDSDKKSVLLCINPDDLKPGTRLKFYDTNPETDVPKDPGPSASS